MILPRNKFSITYPDLSPKYTNLFICTHDHLIVDVPRLDIDINTNPNLIFPDSINIHLLAERFIQLPFKNTKDAAKLSIDFTNKTSEYGCLYTGSFKNSKDIFDDQNCVFIRLLPGERINIPLGSIIVEKKSIRECAIMSKMIMDKITLDTNNKTITQNFYTIGSTNPKDVYNDIMKRSDELLDELLAIFKNETFEKTLIENGNIFNLEGKYAPHLNVITDLNKNIFMELNTSDDFKSNSYVTLRITSTNGLIETIEKVRSNFKKLKYKEIK